MLQIEYAVHKYCSFIDELNMNLVPFYFQVFCMFSGYMLNGCTLSKTILQLYLSSTVWIHLHSEVITVKRIFRFQLAPLSIQALFYGKMCVKVISNNSCSILT